MFSLTILLYALVCNTIIGCLLQKAQTSKKMKQENSGAFFKIRDDANKTIMDHEGAGKQSIDYEKSAEMFNMIAKWLFALSVIIFNLVFWTYSISQYVN